MEIKEQEQEQELELKQNPDKQESTRNSSGQWMNGVSGNLKGRPPYDSIEKILQDAIEEARKRHRKTILVHFVDRAYKSDTVLICLMKKLIADKVHVDGNAIGGMIQLNVIVNGENGNRKPALIRRIEGDTPQALAE